MVISVTGGIACGKSEVGRILGNMGFIVCDADRIAHGLMRKGTSVFQEVVDHFGTRILTGAGEIARPILGNIVFENPVQREALNRLVHPAVRDALSDWISQMRSNGKNAAVQVPLLFESGMDSLDWDAVVCVSNSEERVFKWLEKRGLDRAGAERRLRSQMPLAEKEKRAGWVVPNLGTLKELEMEVRQAVKQIAGRKD